MFGKRNAPTALQSGRGNRCLNQIYNNTSLYAYQQGIDNFNKTYEADEWLTEILVKLHLAEYADGGFENGVF